MSVQASIKPRDAVVPQLEAGMTPEKLIDRAANLRDLLREDQDAADERGHYSEQVHQEMKKSGLYRILQPKMFGGWEFEFPVLLKASIEIGRGHPSAAWCYTLASSHALITGAYFPRDVQAELFGDGHFAAPHKAIPAGTFTPTEGGYIANGTWTFASGIPVATHFFGACMLPGENGGPPRPRNFVVEKSKVQVLKDWGGPEFSLGMQASGSNAVKLENVFIPHRHFMRADNLIAQDPSGAGTYGTELHGNPMYLAIVGGAYHTTFGGIFTGTARAALDEFAEIMKRRPGHPMGGGSRMADPTAVATYGKAMQLTDAAEELTMAAGRMYMDQCFRWKRTGKPITPEDTLRLWGVAQEAVQLANRATTMLFQSSGATNIAPGKRMNRYFRDIQMYIVHPSAQPSIAQMIGQTTLGINMNHFDMLKDPPKQPA